MEFFLILKKHNNCLSCHFLNGGEMIMKTLKYTSHNELLERINWLETEIDMCLSCDLPIVHLDQELCTLSTKTKVNSQNQYTSMMIVNLK